ncbi:glycosyltransferase [Cellvibrio zantedeschiae]|nr:glycosyltransferase [Cellvibrio zantedeschiae]
MINNEILVSIVIPAYNEEKYIGMCLQSLSELEFDKDKLEIIVVDNGSTDRTLEIARSYTSNVIIKEKVKVGAVRNYGVSHAKGKYIVFLDSDCVVDKQWLSRGINKLQKDSKLVLGGQYLMRESPSWLEKYWVLTNSVEKIYQTTLVGGCIFIENKTFESVAGFNENLNSGEDSDLTYRLIQADFTVNIDPSLSVIHMGYPSEILPFIKRQIWHSSDYITSLKKSLKDKIFILTLCFMIGVITFTSGLLFHGHFNLLFLLLMVTPPALLSYKRISRSQTTYTGFFDVISIYAVDWLYLIGRTCGILLSFKNALANPAKDQKVDIR